MTRELAELTWTELPPRAVVVVPVGSTEQHGPHLPLNTDTVIATAVAHAVAEELDGYVAPPICIAASGEHQGFPGVLSIGTEALHLVIMELVRSLSLWAGRVVLVNGHGGNSSTVQAAVDELAAEGHPVTWAPCSAAGDAHAGRTETSLMLHLAPWLVRHGRAEIGNTEPLVTLLPQLVAQGVQKLSPNGILGDPAGASAEEGAVVFRAMLAQALGAC